MINDVYNLFLKVVETGSISKAANELFISQPALSQQLKKLEKEFNAKLFTRSNKGIELTKEGKIVYKYFFFIINFKIHSSSSLFLSKFNRSYLY